MSKKRYEIRRGRDRGRLKTDWLDAALSFSFGAWRDPTRDSFGPLRAFNDDVVQPGTGFAMHGHSDLDIFMLPLDGCIEHRDDLGHTMRIGPGTVHRMWAGTGIHHSQMNPSREVPDRHLQIWLQPRHHGGRPRVETRAFNLFGPAGNWCRVATPDGNGGTFALDQAAGMATTRLVPGIHAVYPAAAGSDLYLHVIDGTLVHDGVALEGGDALAVREWPGMPLRLEGSSTVARALLFEFGACLR